VSRDYFTEQDFLVPPCSTYGIASGVREDVILQAIDLDSHVLDDLYVTRIQVMERDVMMHNWILPAALFSPCHAPYDFSSMSFFSLVRKGCRVAMDINNGSAKPAWVKARFKYGKGLEQI
jgi:hypothetical protein